MLNCDCQFYGICNNLCMLGKTDVEVFNRAGKALHEYGCYHSMVLDSELYKKKNMN